VPPGYLHEAAASATSAGAPLILDTDAAAAAQAAASAIGSLIGATTASPALTTVGRVDQREVLADRDLLLDQGYPSTYSLSFSFDLGNRQGPHTKIVI
jgi:hypothetical protein